MFKLELEKTETRSQIGNIHWIMAKQENSNIYNSASLTMVKIHCVDHNKLQKILKDLEISDYLPASWEICIQVKKQQWEQDTEKQMIWNWEKKKNKTTISSPCLFNLYAEHILENAGLEETQAEIKRKIEISMTFDMQMTPPIWYRAKNIERASWCRRNRRVKKLA